MMMTRLQFALSVVLAFVRFASGEESLEAMPLEDLVDHFISTFDRNMHEGHAAQMLGASERRLADAEAGDAKAGDAKAGEAKAKRAVGTIPDVTYATICGGDCWTKLKNEFTESLKVMDLPTCKTKKNKEKAEKVKTDKAGAKAKIDKKKSDDAKKAGGGKAAGGTTGAAGGNAAGDDKKAEDDKKKKAEDDKKKAAGGARLLAAKTKPVKKESDCIFDLCTVPQVADMCTFNATSGNYSIDKYELDDCKKANAMFICKSVCSAPCKDNAEMKKLVCGKTGTEGKFDTDAGGGSLKKMFNGICSKNADDKYCYDVIKDDLANSSYDVATDKAKEGKMPDPCAAAAAANCASPLGKAVKALGCCFPVLMEVQKKYNVIKRESARFAKATAVACAKDTSFAACPTGQLTKIKSKQFTLTSSGSCDNLGSESAEDAFATSMSDQLNLTAGDVEVLTCKTKGSKCDTRRLGEERKLSTGSEVDVNVQVSGEDADAQMITLAAEMDAGLAATLTATADEMAEGETAEAAVDTAATTSATTTTGGAAMVSSALYRRASSFALAIVLGSAWLGQSI